MTRQRGRYLLGALVALLLGAPGCADDSVASDAGTIDLAVAGEIAVDLPAVPDQALDQAPDQALTDGRVTGSLVVTVLSIEGDHWDPHDTHPGWFVVDSAPPKPLANATVAADLPGGKRVELTSASDGRVTVSGVDWRQGTVDVTGYSPGHVMRSLMGIRRADGDLTLYLIKYKDPPDTIVVSGTATGLTPGMTNLGVGATTWGNSDEGPDATYAVSVEKGKPFTLLGVHSKFMGNGQLIKATIMGFSKASHAGATSDVTLDLSFTTKLTPVTVSGTMELPTGAGSVMGTTGRPRWWVRQRGNSAILGFTTETSKVANGQYAYTGQYVVPASTAGVITTYIAQGYGMWWYGSYVEVDGFPKPGAKVPRFLDVPVMVKPAAVNALAPMNAPIEWKNPEPGATPVIRIYHSTTLAYAWIVETRPASTKVTLPTLPSTATAAAVFGLGGTNSTRVVLCADRDVAKQWCVRHADGNPFWLMLTP